MARLRSRSRSGLTLLEILIVTVMILILSGIAFVSREAIWGDARVKAASDKLRAVFAEARARAIEDGVNYRFCVRHDSPDYKLAPDANEYWDGSSTPQRNEDDPPVMIDESSLPKEVKFNVTNGSGDDWQTIVVFNADGTCSDDASISLSDGDGTPVVIRIRAMTGAASTQKRTSTTSGGR
jgi:Tfp pilus assembly protein FimT